MELWRTRDGALHAWVQLENDFGAEVWVIPEETPLRAMRFGSVVQTFHGPRRIRWRGVWTFTKNRLPIGRPHPCGEVFGEAESRALVIGQAFRLQSTADAREVSA